MYLFFIGVLLVMLIIALLGWACENHQRKQQLIYFSESFNNLAAQQKKQKEKTEKQDQQMFYLGAKKAFEVAQSYIDYELKGIERG